jgi:hypothetical protein
MDPCIQQCRYLIKLADSLLEGIDDAHIAIEPQPASTYPPIAVLREKFNAVYTDLCVAAAEADPSLLAAVNPYEPARHPFYTAGEFVAYMMSGHLAYHVGQLSAWRAAAGIARSGRPDNLAA